MASGASQKAVALVAAGGEFLASTGAEVPDAIQFLGAHGVTKVVDRELRRVTDGPEAWTNLTPERAGDVARIHPGLAVLLGAHRNGYVREAAVAVALDLMQSPGVVSMLTQRANDAVPPIRENAQAALRDLFVTELGSESGGEMPTVLGRAANGIVANTDSVGMCPELVLLALDCFAARKGRYRRDRGNDHFQRTLKDVDRRSQILAHLRRSAEQIDEPLSRQANDRLIEFYQHSLSPPTRSMPSMPSGEDRTE